MAKIKKFVEEAILISVFAVFFTASVYAAVHGGKYYVQIIAISSAVFCAKSAVLTFCRSTGRIAGYRAQILSYQTTAFCICLFVIAIFAKYIF